MSYRTDKEERKKISKRKAVIWLCVTAVLLTAFFVFASFYPPETWKYYVRTPEISKRRDGELRLHFLDVGQGDCTLIELPDGKILIVDGGNGTEETSAKILRYLNALEIKTIDFMVLTHSDSDHAGSLDKILKNKLVKKVYYPKIDDFSINPEFAEFCSALQKSGAEKEYSEVGKVISSTGKYPYRIVFLSPSATSNPNGEYGKVNTGDYTDGAINDTSAVLLIEYANRRALLMGDSSTTVEEKLMRADEKGVWNTDALADLQLKADVLKVAHHGSSTASSEKFLQYIGVRTAVISCGKNNLYGHPETEVLHRLNAVKAEILRTDLHGDILITFNDKGAYTIEK